MNGSTTLWQKIKMNGSTTLWQKIKSIPNIDEQTIDHVKNIVQKFGSDDTRTLRAAASLDKEMFYVFHILDHCLNEDIDIWLQQKKASASFADKIFYVTSMKDEIVEVWILNEKNLATEFQLLFSNIVHLKELITPAAFKSKNRQTS